MAGNGNPSPSRWKAGQSGNPTGRTAPQMSMAKNLARYIAERTANGEQLADRLIELGLELPATNAAEKRIAVAAIEALMERGAGKATQEVQLTLSNGTKPSVERMRQLTDEDLEVLARLDLAEPGELSGDEAAVAIALLDAGGDQPTTTSVIDAVAVEVPA